MSSDYLHNHEDFADLLRIVGEEMQIAPVLVEKDYWIMQCLYGLQQLGLDFQLKGGTSLSKGYGLINRFSEDIDIQINPPEGTVVHTGANQNKAAHIESRRQYYDSLAATIKVDGIVEVVRDAAFDDERYRSAGIRLIYPELAGGTSDLKTGVLLEVGFDDVTPNQPRDITSWAYDFAVSQGVSIIDNRAKGVLCYHPGYTLIEKLQTISTKFRKQQQTGEFPVNFMRHYYDVYSLLADPVVQAFIGTEEYRAHKVRRFRSENQIIAENPAFLLDDPETFAAYERAYESTRSLYYRDRPAFSDILARIKSYAGQL